MSEPKVELVELHRLSIDLPLGRHSVAGGAEGDEIVILMRLTLRPRGDVVNFDYNLSASGNCAPMASFDQDAAAKLGWYLGPIGHDSPHGDPEE